MCNQRESYIAICVKELDRDDNGYYYTVPYHSYRDWRKLRISVFLFYDRVKQCFSLGFYQKYPIEKIKAEGKWRGWRIGDPFLIEIDPSTNEVLCYKSIYDELKYGGSASTENYSLNVVTSPQDGDHFDDVYIQVSKKEDYSILNSYWFASGVIHLSMAPDELKKIVNAQSCYKESDEESLVRYIFNNCQREKYIKSLKNRRFCHVEELMKTIRERVESYDLKKILENLKIEVHYWVDRDGFEHAYEYRGFVTPEQNTLFDRGIPYTKEPIDDFLKYYLKLGQTDHDMRGDGRGRTGLLGERCCYYWSGIDYKQKSIIGGIGTYTYNPKSAYFSESLDLFGKTIRGLDRPVGRYDATQTEQVKQWLVDNYSKEAHCDFLYLQYMDDEYDFVEEQMKKVANPDKLMFLFTDEFYNYIFNQCGLMIKKQIDPRFPRRPISKKYDGVDVDLKKLNEKLYEITNGNQRVFH